MDNKSDVVLRYYKVLDKKNRVLIPNAIIKQQKAKGFYVELHENGNIVLVPVKEVK